MVRQSPRALDGRTHTSQEGGSGPWPPEAWQRREQHRWSSPAPPRLIPQSLVFSYTELVHPLLGGHHSLHLELVCGVHVRQTLLLASAVTGPGSLQSQQGRHTASQCTPTPGLCLASPLSSSQRRTWQPLHYHMVAWSTSVCSRQKFDAGNLLRSTGCSKFLVLIEFIMNQSESQR